MPSLLCFHVVLEEEFEHLAYRHVQLATDGVPIDTAATPGKWPVMPGREVEHPLDAIDEARHDQHVRIGVEYPPVCWIRPPQGDVT